MQALCMCRTTVRACHALRFHLSGCPKGSALKAVMQAQHRSAPRLGCACMSMHRLQQACRCPALCPVCPSTSLSTEPCAAHGAGLFWPALHQPGWALFEHVGDCRHRGRGHTGSPYRRLGAVMPVLSGTDMLWMLLLPMMGCWPQVSQCFVLFLLPLAVSCHTCMWQETVCLELRSSEFRCVTVVCIIVRTCPQILLGSVQS